VLGKAGHEPDFDPEEHQETWTDYYAPLAMWPMPDVFKIPHECPSDVATDLRASFALIWSDRNAAAGRLRAAVEQLLTGLAIARYRTERGKAGKRGRHIRLSLHRRLELLERRAPTMAKNLMGVKWLGNTGTHETKPVTIDDLLAAYAITSHALDELVGKRTKKIAASAKKLTKKHRN
jgi:hypothetical protein